MPPRPDTFRADDDGMGAPGYGYTDAKTAAGERDLWCAVIAQAFVDIGAIKPANADRPEADAPAVREREFDEAIRWLLRDKRDFPYICELAGVSPHIIRCAARIFHGRRQLALGAMHMASSGVM